MDQPVLSKLVCQFAFRHELEPFAISRLRIELTFHLLHHTNLENIYHLFTETEGNSVFCGPEIAVVALGEAEGNNGSRGATKHTAFPRSQ